MVTSDEPPRLTTLGVNDLLMVMGEACAAAVPKSTLRTSAVRTWARNVRILIGLLPLAPAENAIDKRAEGEIDSAMRRADRGIRIGETREVVAARDAQRAAEPVARLDCEPGGTRSAQRCGVAPVRFARKIEARSDALIAAQPEDRSMRCE